jgi:hypothetical protein
MSLAHVSGMSMVVERLRTVASLRSLIGIPMVLVMLGI